MLDVTKMSKCTCETTPPGFDFIGMTGEEYQVYYAQRRKWFGDQIYNLVPHDIYLMWENKVCLDEVEDYFDTMQAHDLVRVDFTSEMKGGVIATKTSVHHTLHFDGKLVSTWNFNFEKVV